MRENLSRRVRALPWLVAGAPRWAVMVVGLLCIGLGGLLVVRPLAAVTTLSFYIGASCVASGIGDLLTRRTDRHDADPWRFLPALGWLAVGLTLLLWRGHGVGFLVVAVALLLIVGGVVRLIRAVGRRRLFAGIFGLSEAAWGVLALVWPDVTLLVVAVLFGLRTVGFGVGRVVQALQPERRPSTAQPTASARPRRRWRAVAAIASLALVTGAVALSLQLRQGVPVLDGFYATPDPIPAAPGQLLRTEPYDGYLPDGMVGVRILYSTTASDGAPAVASGVLAHPVDAAGEVPLVAWAHGTVGVAGACAPSLGPNALADTEIPSAAAVVEGGWALVMSDYTGMGAEGAFPYLVGTGQAYSMLDAIRAAQQVETVELSGQTVVWGHSQGGHAALWTGQLAPDYAPELDLLGIASLSPASDPQRMAAGIAEQHNSPATLLATGFVADAYSRTYGDVALDEVILPAAMPLVREAATRCTTDLSTLVTLLSGLSIGMDQPILTQHPTTGALGARLAENRADGPWQMPVFLAHGTADEVIPVAHSEDLIPTLCTAAPHVEAHLYPDRTHMSMLRSDSPLTDHLGSWTARRFAGATDPDGTCR